MFLERLISYVVVFIRKFKMTSINRKRIAYHEAGHAFVAFSLHYRDELSVVMYSPPVDGKLGLTTYRRIENPANLQTHRMNLLQIAFAGCAGENIYCKHEGISDDRCQYFHSDDPFIHSILDSSGLTPIQCKKLSIDATYHSLSLVQSNHLVIKDIAELLLNNPGVIFGCDALEEIINRPRT